MVALHNRRLTARDIWPDRIWTWEDEARVSARMEAELLDRGITRGDVAFVFEHAKMMERHRRRTSPGSIGQQQRVMAQIYPPKPAAPSFSRDELELIMGRFSMANDELGQQIHEKAAAMLGGLESDGVAAPDTR